MFSCHPGTGSVLVDFEHGSIVSLTYAGQELIGAPAPLFTIRLREKGGEPILLNAIDAASVQVNDNSAVYSGFAAASSLTVRVQAKAGDDLRWRIAISGCGDLLCEWVDFPGVYLAPLKQNGGVGEILFPYNEGAIVDDLELREKSWFRSFEPEYPSSGSYAMFPNMVQSQFLCYLFDGHGLYMGAEDEARGVKGIDFRPAVEGDFTNVSMRFRLFCGVERGTDYEMPFDMVWKFFDGSWEDGAEIYRQWFETHLPSNVKKVAENENLPDWYEDTPLVVSYPVRGKFDTDVMDPNALFPYTNALPFIDEVAERTGCRILVLLMHWEGTAPWAPPFVWPPFGGEENFRQFLDELHSRGNLLGVYCSGFGFTIQSNLVAEYNCAERYEKENLERAMCVGPDGKVHISRICTAQRSGYDLCVKSEAAQKILDEAYRPLLQSGIDYVQILDQNHGGGQYFCYAEDHGHPPAPGPWMTSSMRDLLDGWNEMAGKTLFGCESAAGEPFIGNLLFSDNRYELNYRIGRPVPLYAYIYHEYLRNFSGNQVCCGLSEEVDTMRLRMAYSYTAGDCMTLVITPDYKLLNNWGSRNFDGGPDMEKVLQLVTNMQKIHKETEGFLTHGRMIKALPYDCPVTSYPAQTFNGRKYEAPDAFSTAWEADGKRAQIFVNHTEHPVDITFRGETFTLPPLEGTVRLIP